LIRKPREGLAAGEKDLKRVGPVGKGIPKKSKLGKFNPFTMGIFTLKGKDERKAQQERASLISSGQAVKPVDYVLKPETRARKNPRSVQHLDKSYK
jgi:hypothetical protein